MNPEARKEYDKTSHTIRQTSDIRALWGKIARDKENEAKKRARPTADMDQVQVSPSTFNGHRDFTKRSSERYAQTIHHHRSHTMRKLCNQTT